MIKNLSGYSMVLSGGAARGAFHLGILQYLDDKGIKVKALSGSSIGAIIAGSYSAGITPKEQLKIFNSKEFKDAIKFNYFKKGIFKIDQEAKIFKELVPYKYIEQLPIPVHITTLDLISGKKIVFDKGEILPLSIASCALTPLFEPIDYKQYRLVDGGIIDNMPVEPLKKCGFPIIGSNLHPFVKYNCSDNIFKILKRAFKLMWLYRFENSVKECDIYLSSNDLLQYKLFSFKHLNELYDLGYKTAKEVIKA